MMIICFSLITAPMALASSSISADTVQEASNFLKRIPETNKTQPYLVSIRQSMNYIFKTNKLSLEAAQRISADSRYEQWYRRKWLPEFRNVFAAHEKLIKDIARASHQYEPRHTPPDYLKKISAEFYRVADASYAAAIKARSVLKQIELSRPSNQKSTTLHDSFHHVMENSMIDDLARRVGGQ